MKMIRCPACNASGVLCSTCDGKRFVPYDGSIDWAEMTETDEDWMRVKKDQGDYPAARKAL